MILVSVLGKMSMFWRMKMDLEVVNFVKLHVHLVLKETNVTHVLKTWLKIPLPGRSNVFALLPNISQQLIQATIVLHARKNAKPVHLRTTVLAASQPSL